MAERTETATEIKHPLAVTRAELVWEGKYDSAGNRVAPLRVALPFQTVETVNESAAARRHTLELFGQHRQGMKLILAGRDPIEVLPTPREFPADQKPDWQSLAFLTNIPQQKPLICAFPCAPVHL